MHSIAERKKHKKHQKWLKNAHKMSLQNNEKYKQHKYNQFKLALARHAQDKHKYNQFKMALARHAISVEDTSISTPISYITPPKMFANIWKIIVSERPFSLISYSKSIPSTKRNNRDKRERPKTLNIQAISIRFRLELQALFEMIKTH
eukprot:1098664_1